MAKKGDTKVVSPRIKSILLGTGVIAIFLLSFSIGRFYIPIKEVIAIIISHLIQRIELLSNLPFDRNWTEQMEIVVINIRLPRIIGAALIGASLAAAGSVYQGIFNNPMVSPDLLGASAGSGFGAALAIFMGLDGLGISLCAFIIGLLAVLLAMLSAERYQHNPTLGLVLAGIMIASTFSAATSFIKLVADPTNQLPAITYWLMGSLASLKKEDLLLLAGCTIVGLIPLLLLRWKINLLTQSDEVAEALGVNVKRLRLIVIVCSTLISSACVAVSGMIGWVGLIVPHIARRWGGCNYNKLLPVSILVGAGFMMIVDNFARTLMTTEIPIGILTAFIGAPFFLHMLLKGGPK